MAYAGSDAARAADAGSEPMEGPVRRRKSARRTRKRKAGTPRWGGGDTEDSNASHGAPSAPPPLARPRGLICGRLGRLPLLGPQGWGSLMMGWR